MLGFADECDQKTYPGTRADIADILHRLIMAVRYLRSVPDLVNKFSIKNTKTGDKEIIFNHSMNNDSGRDMRQHVCSVLQMRAVEGFIRFP